MILVVRLFVLFKTQYNHFVEVNKMVCYIMPNIRASIFSFLYYFNKTTPFWLQTKPIKYNVDSDFVLFSIH